MLVAGAIDGLSIGYRTVKAERDGKGQRLVVRNWSFGRFRLVTFPMLPEARVSAKGEMRSDGPIFGLKDVAASVS